jgi:hypothetical protein
MSQSAKIDDLESTFEFALKNVGKQAVLIRKLTPSCGCAAVSSNKDVYLPGEAGKIVAKIDIGSFHGEMEKSVLVETDSNDHKYVKLIMKLSVPSLITLSKNTLEWGKNRDSTEQVVTAKVTGTLPLRIVGVKPLRDSFRAKLTPVQEGHEYEISISPTSTANDMTTAIELVTDLTETNNRRRIWIFVRVVSESSAQPPDSDGGVKFDAK